MAVMPIDPWESTSNRAAAMALQRRLCICLVDSDMVKTPRECCATADEEGHYSFAVAL
jgi:hypothetical protein